MTASDRSMNQAEDRLEDALAMLAAGIPLADVLAEAGSEAEWLGSLLEVAAETSELQAVIPLPPPTASLERMLAYGKSLAAAEDGAAPSPDGRRSRLRQFINRSWWGDRLPIGLAAAALVISLVVTFLAGSVVGGGLSLVAQDSLPGEALYPIKRASEAIHLTLTSDPEKQQSLRELYDKRRQVETQQLLEQHQQAPVVFDGRVTAITPTTIMVDGFQVQITPQTKISGELQPGARIRVEGVTQLSGKLTASRIVIIEAAPPTPTPLPRATPTQILSKATDTFILEPTATPTSLPAAPVVEPEPTAEPTEAEDKVESEPEIGDNEPEEKNGQTVDSGGEDGDKNQDNSSSDDGAVNQDDGGGDSRDSGEDSHSGGDDSGKDDSHGSSDKSGHGD
jgi:hypothetical protein